MSTVKRDVTGMSLYMFEGCPYCDYVVETMEELGLEIEKRDTDENSKFRDELVAATGKTMVPCLRMDEGGESKWMHESEDIVEYLQKRFGS